jgi:uncharacterized protein YndB with AHSA1/START domain
MVHIHGDIVIDRPPEEVFDVVADTSTEPRHNPRMHHAEQITNGPIGVGTRFHAETASMGRPVDMVIEITDYHRPHSLSSTTHMSSMNLHGTLTFEPVPEGTRTRMVLGPGARWCPQAAQPVDRHHRSAAGTEHLDRTQTPPGNTPELRSRLGQALSVNRNRIGGLISGPSRR